jgi:uncharacterized protein (TIGR03437 family)
MDQLKNAFAKSCSRRPVTPLLLLAFAALAQAQPVIQSFTPTTVVAGRSAFQLVVTGAGFTSQSQIVWRFGTLAPVALQTGALDDVTLIATVPSNLVAEPGAVPIAVTQTFGSTILSSNVVTLTILSGLFITTPCPLPNGSVGSPYNVPFTATGGAPPYNWSLGAGAFPPGLALTSTGALTGTPTTIGAYNFTIQVTDSQQTLVTQDCSIQIGESTGQSLTIVFINPTSVIAGSGPVTLSITGNAFQPGATIIWNFGTGNSVELGAVVLNPSLISTILPANLLTQPGLFRIAVRQPVLTSQVISNSLEFRILPALSIASGCPLPPGSLNSGYSASFVATGGLPPYTWTLGSSNLPAGLTFSASGSLTGSPTQAGIFSITALVTDSTNNTVTVQCSFLIAGPLVVSPNQLSLRATQGQPATGQALSVTCPNSNSSCAFRVSLEGLRLLIEATSGRTPALVRLIPDTTAAPGRVDGNVVISSDDSSNRTVRVPVSIVIDQAPPPSLSLSPSELSVAAPRGSTDLIRRILGLRNPGLGSFQAVIRSTVPWIRSSLSSVIVSNRTPVVVPVSIDPATLGQGTHTGAILVEALSQTSTVNVKVAVNASGESMRVIPDGFTFTAFRDGPSPPSANFLVFPSGRDGFFVEGTPSTIAGGPWLSLDPASNAARLGDPARFTITANSRTLAPDLYFGQVTLNAPAANNSPRAVSAVLRVLAPDATVPVQPQPSGHVFVGLPGLNELPSQAFQVFNPYPVPVNIDATVIGNQGVFVLTASTGAQVPSGQSRGFRLSVQPRGLASGVYRASIAITSSRSPDAVLSDILLVVPRVAGVNAAKQEHRELAGCTPTRLLAVSTALPVNFSAPGGLPVPIEARVTDDCGDPLTTGAVQVSFSNGNAPVALTHIAEGRWSGTWPIQQVDATPVTLTFRAEDPARTIEGSLDLIGNIEANDGVPIISDGGLLSAASFSNAQPLAPGSLFSIFGSRLADGSATPSSLPLPGLLGSTRVAVSGLEAPLFFAGQLTTFSQVNAMLPYTLAPNSVHQISVRRGNRRSNFVDLVLDQVQPAVFTANQSGSGQGVVVDGANPTAVANIFNPVRRGGVVIIYCEGLGPTDPPVLAGQAVPASPLSLVRAPVTVTIGGQPAQVLFAGLTPFFTGLYQLNVTVPETITPGDAVPVVVSAGGKSSIPVTIAVR